MQTDLRRSRMVSRISKLKRKSFSSFQRKAVYRSYLEWWPTRWRGSVVKLGSRAVYAASDFPESVDETHPAARIVLDIETKRPAGLEQHTHLATRYGAVGMKLSRVENKWPNLILVSLHPLRR